VTLLLDLRQRTSWSLLPTPQRMAMCHRFRLHCSKMRGLLSTTQHRLNSTLATNKNIYCHLAVRSYNSAYIVPPKSLSICDPSSCPRRQPSLCCSSRLDQTTGIGIFATTILYSAVFLFLSGPPVFLLGFYLNRIRTAL
jgi:hypothetical protein